MGERKGQNKYYPPDFFSNAKTMSKGLDAYHGHHTLRERGKKAHLGILVIRFEMPYNIWCEGCKNHIGMGVRYNAEKQKVGNYYSTPMYEFKMKCHLCDNYITIRTDPKNLDYEIMSGARRQENRWDPTQNEQIVPETKETQRRLFDDAMYKLEHGVKDQKAAHDAKPVLCKLFQRNEDVWRDSFEANSKLRSQFRSSKRELKAVEDADESVLKRTSLKGSVKLLPEIEEDRQLAGLLKLRSTKTIEVKSRERMIEVMERPALKGSGSGGGVKNKMKKKLMGEKIGELGIVRKIEVVKRRKVEATTVGGGDGGGGGASLIVGYSSSSDDNGDEKC
jgi:coiled-coil domain-containing protein 130